MHSHLLWLGLFADSLGFENLFMQAWPKNRLRPFNKGQNFRILANKVIIWHFLHATRYGEYSGFSTGIKCVK